MILWDLCSLSDCTGQTVWKVRKAEQEFMLQENILQAESFSYSNRELEINIFPSIQSCSAMVNVPVHLLKDLSSSLLLCSQRSPTAGLDLYRVPAPGFPADTIWFL